MENIVRIFEEDWGRPPSTGPSAPAGARKTQRCELSVVSNRITAREIISQRLIQQQGDGPERAGTSDRDDAGRSEEVARVAEAFDKRRLVILVDGVRVTSLDDRFELDRETDVTFIHLYPLKGG